jgi:hypothetical protein
MNDTSAPVLADYAYGRFVVKNRWLLIVLSLVAVVASGYGAQFLQMNPDSRVFFSKDNPHLQALEQFENTYTKDDNLMYVLAPKSGDVFTRDSLDAVRWLTDESWQTPFSNRVDSITNFQHSQADGDDLVVDDMYEGGDDVDLAFVRDVVMTRKTLVDRLVAESGAVTAVNVNVILPGKSLDEVPQIAAFGRARAAEFAEKYPDIDLYLVGGTMINMAFSEVPVDDMMTLFPIMILLILVIIGIALRSVLWTLLTLVAVVFAVIIIHGLAGWLGVILNAGTTGTPIILLTLAIAHGVHIMVTAQQQMRKGTSKHDAIVESLRVNMAPVFITSVTTAIGFLSMNFSDAPPFRLLGNLVAGGVMVAFVLSVVFLPAVMAVLPAPVGKGKTIAGPIMEKLADFVIARKTGLLWGFGLIIVILVAGTTRIDLDDDFIKYFDERYDIRTHADFTQENMTGLNVLEYSVPAGEEGGVADPEYLIKLGAFANWFREQPKVHHVYALTDIMKRLNQNMHGDETAWYKLPEDHDLAAQYLLLYQLSLPYGLDLNNAINVSRSATRMTVIVTDITSKEMRELDVHAQAWLSANMPEYQAPGTGLSLMFSYISERNINSMLIGSSVALVLISLVLIIALRSLKIGLLSLVPNLFPAAMAFGIWGYVSGQVGLAIAVVIAMTLGIVVDDTVHFLSKYLRARREHDMDAETATRYAFNTVGTALWVTTVCLVCGFLVLAFSGFKVNSEMGLLSAVTIAIALAADFFFLPPLLMKLEPKKS